jgi:hypothetical protein
MAANHFEGWDGIPRVVHVLAISYAGCAVAGQMIERAGDYSKRNVTVDRRAFCRGSLDPLLHQPLDGCAAVVVLSPDGADDDVFARAVHAVVEQGAARDDFRVYVVLDGLTPEYFHDSANAGLPLFEYLRENVQLTSGLSADEAELPLAEYLTKLPETQSRTTWRRLRADASIAVGHVATGIQLASPVILLCGWALVKTRWAEQWGAGIGIVREFVSISAGILHFWATMIPAYFILRGFSAPSAAARDAEWVMPKSILSLVVSFAALKLALEMGAGNPWTVLGIAIGACVDGARRAGLQAQRLWHGLDPQSANPEITGLAANLAGVGPANIFRLPIWPAISQSIVISYARASKWSFLQASELFTALEKTKTPVFLDRIRIPIGSNWRRDLRYEIGVASTFICVLDQLAVNRLWVAAEFFSAIHGQALTGSPRVIVVESPDLNLDAARPIFRDALIEDSAEGTKVHVLRRIRASNRTVEVLSHELKPERFQPASVVPNTIAVMLTSVLGPITVLCAFAAMVGLLAWLAWIVEMWNGMPILHRLNPGVTSALFLLLAYLAGCGCRLTVVSRFQIRHDDPGSLAASQGFGAIGLILFCALWSRALPPLIQGWALVAIAFGWWRAGAFFNYSVLGDPTLTRPGSG